jgi:hypothetical protein
MAELLFSKPVQKVIGLEPDPLGRLRPFRIYSKKAKKKRKVSWVLRPHERTLRRYAEAEATFVNDYLRRHNKSSKKKRNGYLRDLSDNTDKAYRKAMKQFFN